MNKLINTNQIQTMSSRDIAILTGKELSHVHRDIKTQFAELYDIRSDDPDLDHKLSQYLIIEFDNRGYISVVNLDKEQTYTLIAGYSVKLRNAIVKRWQELENKQHMNMPQTFAEALQLAADQARQIEILELDNKETRQERNAAINTINKLGDVLAYQARVLEAREKDRLDLCSYRQKKRHR